MPVSIHHEAAMERIISVGFALLSLVGGLLVGGIAGTLFSDPFCTILGAVGGGLGFVYFISWTINPVITRCPSCHAAPRAPRQLFPSHCSRCAVKQAA